MEEESRAVELALESHNLVYIWFVLYRKKVSITVRLLCLYFGTTVTLLALDSVVSWYLIMTSSAAR